MGISIEIGSVVGSVASSLPAPAIDIGGHLGGSLGQGMDFLGSRMGLVNIGPVINEGPAGLSGLENTMTLIQAPKPSIPVEPSGVQPLTEIPKTQEVIFPRAESEFRPIPAPNIIEFPKSKIVVFPALEPNTKAEDVLNAQARSQPATEKTVSFQSVPDTQTELLLKEEDAEVVAEEAHQKIDKGVLIEEVEGQRLMNVVDGKVLEKRIEEINAAIAQAGLEAVISSNEEIEGKRIAELVPYETEEKRSGIVKKQGPDGSRVETLEDIASRKFKSIREAKKQAIATVHRKVPVKRDKKGKRVGFEAVARVLKYLFIKPHDSEHNPEQVAVKIKKKRQQALSWSEVFQKAIK